MHEFLPNCSTDHIRLYKNNAKQSARVSELRNSGADLAVLYHEGGLSAAGLYKTGPGQAYVIFKEEVLNYSVKETLKLFLRQ